MAVLYLKTAGGTWSSANTWSTTGSGGADNSGPPAATTDVILELLSGALTIDSGAVCRSLSAISGTGNYGGTITHNVSTTLTVGDATAGAGSVALAFNAGMVYTINSATTSAISFISTSATVQTVSFAGLTTGNVTFNAASNGSWQYGSGHATGVTATVTLTKGSLDTNGKTCSWGIFTCNSGSTRSLTLGASAITNTGTGNNWAVDTPGLTLSAASSTVTVSGGVNATWNGLGTWGTVVFNSAVTFNGGSSLTCINFTKTGVAALTDNITMSANITCSGTFTCNGQSSINRVFVISSVAGTNRTITAAVVSCTNTDFRFITGAGAATWDLSAQTDIGDAGGNSFKALGSAAFPASSTQTATGTSGFTWSTHGWTTRVPLPQDDVVVSLAFSASQTITADMPRLGRSINFTGTTGNPDMAMAAARVIYGSATFIPGMTMSTSGMTFSGVSNYSITSAGVQFKGLVTFQCFGGSYTLNDALSTNNQISITSGTFNSAGFSITTTGLSIGGTITRVVNLSTSTVFLNGVGGANLLSFGASGFTFTGSSTIFMVNVTATTQRTFNPAGNAIGTLDYSLAGSTGSLLITGSSTYNTINFSDASNTRTLFFTSGTTTHVTTFDGVRGTSGKLMVLDGSTTATYALIKDGGGIVNTDFLDIQHSVATPSTVTWYAGVNSVNHQGVATAGSGWIFTAPPSGGGTLLLLGV